MADKDKRPPEDFDPLEWVYGQQNIADALGVSVRTLRSRGFDFFVSTQHGGFGKPVEATVVCSGTAAEAETQKTIAENLPEARAKAGRASGEARRAKIWGPTKL